ncbi:MAG TPA: C25 family cysteine peptidase [Hyphomonadaceae bacterium]|jgi:hypothetical protein|nr:C25 family cysteine peptidase [Hyphomonadaceae bacterium]
MADRIDKLIVTNLSALRAKYGAGGLSKIKSALARLIAADRKRDLTGKLVDLSSSTQMRAFNARPVTDPLDPRQNKAAIDAVYGKINPDYLLLIGAGDIIAFQDLKNPLHLNVRNQDPDRQAPSDLPYASDQPYSREPTQFQGPTRVVRRLPDLPTPDAPDLPPPVEYLLGVLQSATAWKPHPANASPAHFAVSAQVWKKSTQKSVSAIFSSSTPVETVPARGPDWTKPALSPRFHFINCHGNVSVPEFYGEPEGFEDYPIAMQSVNLPGNIAEGTIVAAECCYGGQIYGVTAAEPVMGICNTYLQQGAYGVFASTTIAYGPAEDNSDADLICQYFLQKVLAGASIGRAALEARQKFVKVAAPLSYTEQKTLAQFNLYGDPSITPVKAAPNAGVANAARAEGGKPSPARTARRAKAAGRADRAGRRCALIAEGDALRAIKAPMKRSKTGHARKAMLDKEARRLKLDPGDAVTCTVGSKLGAKGALRSKALTSYQPPKTSYHILFAAKLGRKAKAAPAGAKAAANGKRRIRKSVLLVAKEVGGEIVELKELYAHC